MRKGIYSLPLLADPRKVYFRNNNEKNSMGNYNFAIRGMEIIVNESGLCGDDGAPASIEFCKHSCPCGQFAKIFDLVPRLDVFVGKNVDGMGV